VVDSKLVENCCVEIVDMDWILGNMHPELAAPDYTVRHDKSGMPLSKVYAKTKSGVKFFKDGYTDLRGKFDYASVSTSDLGQVERLSILVMSEKDGATVLEASVPQR